MAKVQIKSEKLTPFGEIFSIMEQFWCSSGSNHRFHLGIEVHTVWLSVQWNPAFSNLRIFLWRLMRWGCHDPPYETSVPPSVPSHLQCGHHIACHQQDQDLCFKFVAVPAKWIRTSRTHVLNIYTDNHAYAKLVPDRLRLIAMSFRSNQRIASSRFMG